MLASSRGQLLVWALAAVLVTLALVRLLDGGGGGAAGEAAPVRVSRPPGEERTGQAKLYVHVAGAVRRPGLYRVPAPARVALAVARAGGPARGAELTAVNLAAKLEDGQQVIVPGAGA
ncbi:MAG TPA: SLBB domain-containing protein, partial [Thermoleophilaceae bacterium]|nr:SLBB domain-containing protein [Thermoleophilaceae bacterium]